MNGALATEIGGMIRAAADRRNSDDILDAHPEFWRKDAKSRAARVYRSLAQPFSRLIGRSIFIQDLLSATMGWLDVFCLNLSVCSAC